MECKPTPPPTISAWGPWNDEANAKDRGMADTTGIEEEEGVRLFEEDRSHVHGGCDADSAIRETQMFDISAGMYTNITSLSEEGPEGGWQEIEEGGRGLSSPRGQQQRGDDGDGGVEMVCTQVEMTLSGMHTGTEAPGRSMWSQFTSALKDMHAPAIGGSETSEGWMPSKRARGSCTDIVAADCVESGAHETAAHEAFNLNLSPDKLDTGISSRGRGRNATTNGRGPGSRGGGRAGGRGTGRAKRLPLLQPRYTSRASHPTSTPTHVGDDYFLPVRVVFNFIHADVTAIGLLQYII